MRKYGYIPQVSLLAVRLGSARASSHPLVGLLGGWGPWEMNTTKSHGFFTSLPKQPKQTTETKHAVILR